MARRGQAKIRKIDADPIYLSVVVTKLINRSMKDGKRTVAEKEIYGAFDIIKATTKNDPMKTFEAAMENIKPTMEVRARRIGGAAYQVPNVVRGPRRESLAIRWLIAAARARSNSDFKTFAGKLAQEIMDSAKGEGAAVKRRTDMERVAEANKAFSHFRW